MNDCHWEQQKRVADARVDLIATIERSKERDVAIWLAALIETTKRVSDWNLEAERKEKKK